MIQLHIWLSKHTDGHYCKTVQLNGWVASVYDVTAGGRNIRWWFHPNRTRGTLDDPCFWTSNHVTTSLLSNTSNGVYQDQEQIPGIILLHDMSPGPAECHVMGGALTPCIHPGPITIQFSHLLTIKHSSQKLYIHIRWWYPGCYSVGMV